MSSYDKYDFDGYESLEEPDLQQKQLLASKHPQLIQPLMLNNSSSSGNDTSRQIRKLNKRLKKQRKEIEDFGSVSTHFGLMSFGIIFIAIASGYVAWQVFLATTFSSPAKFLCEPQPTHGAFECVSSDEYFSSQESEKR